MTDYPFDEEASVTYLMRRLSMTSATALPAVLRFDLARMPVSDDQLEDITSAFGAQKSPGWGLNELLQDALSRQPASIPVDDLSKLQTNLIAHGYAAPDAEVTGTWDPSWYGAFRRMDSDSRSNFYQGHHPMAAPLEAGIRFLTNTVPSQVWQGIVGTAKGIVAQAPETAGRVGLAGGAAAGAALGATVGTLGGPLAEVTVPAAAGVGAVIGGVVGFLGDLLSSDQGEENQSDWSKIIDALTPFEEYSGTDGARKFLEDLGWVASAASMIAGAGIAAKGASAGMAAISGAEAEGATLGGALLAQGAPAAEPGWFTQLVGKALKPVVGSAKVETMMDWVRVNGLQAQAGRPIFKISSGVYTGLSAGQLGSRMVAGYRTGTADIDAEIASLRQRQGQADLSATEQAAISSELRDAEERKAQAMTTIQESIDSTDPLPGYVDLLMLVVNPTQFLPVKLPQIGASFDRLLGAAELGPYANVEQALSHVSFKDALAKVRGYLDPLSNLKIRIGAGVELSAAEKISEAGLKGLEAEGAFAKTKASVVSVLHKELAVGKTDLAAELLAKTVDNPHLLEAYLVKIKGIDSLPGYLEAERLATGITRDIRSGSMPLESWQLHGFYVADAEAAFEQLRGTTKIQRLIDEAAKLERDASKTTDIGVGVSLRAEAIAKRAEAESLKADLPVPQKIARSSENTIVAPERLETMTSGDYHAKADEYLRLREQVISLGKSGQDLPSWAAARGEVEMFVHDLARRTSIPEDIAQAAMSEKPSGKLADWLNRAASTAAGEIELPPALMKDFEALGYKPVVTSGDVLFTPEMESIQGLMPSIGDYTRRRAFFETIGFGVKKSTDESIWRLTQANQTAELDQALQAADVPLSGGQALGRLHRQVDEIARSGATHGPIRFPKERGKLPRLTQVDIRDLSVDDILSAFDGVQNFTDETALSVYAAVKRGAAFGGEAKLRYPADTLRTLGHALRINGLAGFSDFARTARVQRPYSLVVGGAVAGGVAGALSGDSLGDVVKGATEGAAAGMILGPGIGKGALRGAAVRTYGYLPDALVRLNTALRYSLSLTFDAGRYTEAASTEMAKYGLPGIFRPKRYVRMLGEIKTPYGVSSGDGAWDAALRFRDELSGGSTFKSIEAIDRSATSVGLLGFTPRDHEAAYALLAWQRGFSKDRILEVVANVNRYGTGRSAAEKSVNFVIFPFSFMKKYITTLGDFMIQAPARTLLLHEGLRRYYSSSADERFHDLIENHAPLLKLLARVNNLTYGVSPGRFFLEGLSDNRTNAGKVADILTSMFVPSGAATPLAQLAGGLGDYGIHAFIPVIVTGESMNRAGGVEGFTDLIKQYVPLIREIDQYKTAIGEQVVSLVQGRTPDSQYQEYVNQLRDYKDEIEPLAHVLGYSSADGLLSSQIGLPFRGNLQNLETELRKKYPSGASMADTFTNTALTHRRALTDLSEKPNRSEGEDAIVDIAEEQFKWQLLATVAHLPSEVVGALSALTIRREAVKYATDRRFRELYEYLFASEYGPISRVA